MIAVHFDVTGQDYTNALWAHYWYTRRPYIAAGAVLLLASAAVCFSATPTGGGIAVWLPAVALAGMIIYITLISPLRAMRSYARDPRLSGPITYTFDDQHIAVTTPQGETTLGWDTLGEFVETDEYYLLLPPRSRGGVRFIPRRAFATEAEETAFQKLLGRHLAAPAPR